MKCRECHEDKLVGARAAKAGVPEVRDFDSPHVPRDGCVINTSGTVSADGDDPAYRAN